MAGGGERLPGCGPRAWGACTRGGAGRLRLWLWALHLESTSEARRNSLLACVASALGRNAMISSGV
jgi:hypothetical protein